ncbi:COG1361 S-layer family protein [Candidatus Woesearchaeota archaeon]|nr:COG1361 S-layer family protein [Candidatus Woesearchaeota archaeon]
MTNKIICILLMAILSISTAYAIDVSVNDYDPKPAEAGKAVNVWFKIQNSGDDAVSDITLEIIPKDSLRLTTGENALKNIGVLAGRSSQTVQYRMIVNSDAFEGTHNIEARIKKGASAASKTDLSIEVTEKDLKDVNLAIGDIESDPSRIKPGDEDVKLDVVLQNLGDGNAQGVKAEITGLSDGITLSESYSGTSLLGNIEADSMSTATFYLDISESVEPGVHKAYVTVSYKYKPDLEEDDYLFEEKKIPLDIAIKPVPLYNISSVELFPSVLTAGDDDVSLRITVKNIGNEEGEAVRIKVYGKTEQPFRFMESSDFIAPSLGPGEEGQGTFVFDVDDDANLQEYYLDIEIKNVVNNDVLTYSKKIPVSVTNSKPDNPWPLVIAGVVVIAVILVYMFIRKVKGSKQKPRAKKVHTNYGSSVLEK